MSLHKYQPITTDPRQFPDLGRSLTAMRIMDKVREKLIGRNDGWSLGFKHSKLPDAAKVEYLKTCIEGNNGLVYDMLGASIVNEINEFK